MTLTTEDYERARMVAEELTWLRDEWIPKVDAASVRRVSPLLRSLLIEGQYVRAWRAIGLPDEPYISATDLVAAVGQIDQSLIQMVFAPASERITRSLREPSQIQLGIVEDIPPGAVVIVVPGYPDSLGPMVAALPPELLGGLDQQRAQQLHVGSRLGTRVVRGIKLSAYLRSPAAFITRETISRQDVIQYVANKAGGVHYDPTRARKQDARLALLDAAKPKFDTASISNFTGMYAEVLSAAENLAESSDLARYLDVFGRTAPPSERAE